MWDQLQSFDYAGTWKPFGQFLWDWQTLIAGVIAVIGARYAIKGVREQISAQKAQDLSRRFDEDFAARAMLPFALDQIAVYAEQVMKLIEGVYLRYGSGAQTSIATGLSTIPKPPSTEVLLLFREAIKSCDLERKKELSELLAWYQVHEARLRPLKLSGLSMVRSLDQALIDAGELHAKATALFEWARRGDDGKLRRSSADEIRHAFFSASVHNMPSEVETMLQVRDAQPKPD